MTRSSDDVAAIVVKHLVDVVGGTCSITREMIEQEEEDRSMCEILTGLLYVHEDLTLREELRVRAESELRDAIHRLEAQNEELERSRAAIAAYAAELSTPVIRVGNGTFMMPIVGSVDTPRAAEIKERLLRVIVEERARYVILDLTGVSTVDTSTAGHFIRILGAIQLLGARGIVAGVQPPIALAIVELGIDLGATRMVRDVEEALHVVIADLAAKAAAAPNARRPVSRPARP